MKMRFVEPDLTEGPTLNLMMDEIFVVCPRCQARAQSVPFDSKGDSQSAVRRLVCERCGLVKNLSGRSISYYWADTSPLEPYFQLPLWLNISCCGRSLWFFNFRHMELIEKYVQAELREKQRHPEYGWFNGSLYNRLPKFIKEAHNREEVLKAIEILKRKA